MSQSFENNVGLLQGEVLSQMKIVFKTVSFKQSKINPKSIIGQNRKKKYLSIRHDKSNSIDISIKRNKNYSRSL